MIIIYGTKAFTKFMGYFGNPQLCQCCQQEYSPSIVRYIRWFHIAEVPIFPYKIIFVKQCPICANGEKIQIKYARQIIKSGMKNENQNISVYGKHILMNKPKGIFKVDTSYELWARDENTKKETCICANVTKDMFREERKIRGLKRKIKIIEV